jgi:hypothetical protein
MHNLGQRVAVMATTTTIKQQSTKRGSKRNGGDGDGDGDSDGDGDGDGDKNRDGRRRRRHQRDCPVET